jgi:hypothetical protein
MENQGVENHPRPDFFLPLKFRQPMINSRIKIAYTKVPVRD